ncbi:trp operon leader peptide [Streptomyces avermitilis]
MPDRTTGPASGSGRRIGRPDRAAGSGKVPGMFAHSIQNWWWTAHPAAH